MAELDELVAAVVRKLPAPGAGFPAENREAWLKMMAMAFDVAYGPADNVIPFPRRQDIAGGLPYNEEFSLGKPVATLLVEAPKPAQAAKPLPRFIIDVDGVAKLGTGEPIVPADVMGEIYDLRGEMGDLSSIVWADGSRGVRGLHLNISTAV